ncbi:MAG TPA: presenilin family intramembrane aspartyl protease PSH [Candidatus Thermoplasmatota archaeon]|jgi:presenilin-like A22 family membrane protease|nr:presenilin family intramembrane aspartyl protease PSH [Candidatus Thermoplasmatota archaeon]
MTDAAAEAQSAAPGGEAAAHAPHGPAPVRAMVGMAGLFVVSIGLAMVAAPIYAAEIGPIFSDPENVGNAAVYLGIVVAFTALILLIARYKKAWLIKGIILGAVLLSLVYLFGPLFSAALRPRLGDAGITAAWAGAAVLATALTIALYKHPEWWVVDAVGVGVAAGACAYFGISFGLLPSLALLIAFAAYDAIAVYRTKHMIALADNVMDLQLPVMLIVPKHRGYSFLREKAKLKEKLEKGEEREALFMGLGDVVIPGVLVVSALWFLNPAAYPPDQLPAWMPAASGGVPPWLLVSLGAFAGALAGYAFLMTMVARGKAHAGLPSLNGGAILGFLLALLPLYGLGPLTT